MRRRIDDFGHLPGFADHERERLAEQLADALEGALPGLYVLEGRTVPVKVRRVLRMVDSDLGLDLDL